MKYQCNMRKDISTTLPEEFGMTIYDVVDSLMMMNDKLDKVLQLLKNNPGETEAE